jgi:subtilisin-like proprotein convertase family protein
MTRLIRRAAVLATAVAALAAPSALAGTATYTNNVPFFVSDSSITNSVITVPAGRTAVQSIEVTGIQIDWGASAQELSVQLISPDGASMFLWEKGCGGAGSYPPNSNFAISDVGTALADGSAPNCTDALLIGGVLRPDDPAAKKMSFFNGKAPSGNWTFRATDSGVQFTNQGTVKSWSLRIVHAPPTLKATALKTGKVGKLSLTATPNADGSLAIGGGAKSGKTNLKANKAVSIPFAPTKKIAKKIAKKGKALVKVDLVFTDETGGRATETVSVTVKRKKK